MQFRFPVGIKILELQTESDPERRVILVLFLETSIANLYFLQLEMKLNESDKKKGRVILLVLDVHCEFTSIVTVVFKPDIPEIVLPILFWQLLNKFASVLNWAHKGKSLPES